MMVMKPTVMKVEGVKQGGKNENSNPSKQPLTLDSSMYKEKSKKK